MKRSKFTESQIVKALKEEANGRSAIVISQELLNPNSLANCSLR